MTIKKKTPEQMRIARKKVMKILTLTITLVVAVQVLTVIQDVQLML